MIFEIAFTPVYNPGSSLIVSVSGAVLSINGDAIDLSPLGDGDLLPAEAAQALHSAIAYEPIECIDGTIRLTLAQPYGYTEAWYGPPIIVDQNGPVTLPFPSEGEPVSGGSTISVDPNSIITAEQREAEAAEAARKAEFPNLEPDQFWGVLRATGYEQPLLDWIAGIEDPVQRAFVSAKLEFAKYFERDHPLIEEARLALGLTETELDDLWRYAHG